eukprot:TRINITY_DN56260_c0_g1_i1.p1 TRINITY_DN56260_c0_g1~~TRINITY_DN56260_c0_g1_i1.p1  ORF type:complete len:722 (+),score=31.28 TRINITY_DN56260_c0_g1_i1:436-2601(+)
MYWLGLIRSDGWAHETLCKLSVEPLGILTSQPDGPVFLLTLEGILQVDPSTGCRIERWLFAAPLSREMKLIEYAGTFIEMPEGALPGLEGRISLGLARLKHDSLSSSLHSWLAFRKDTKQLWLSLAFCLPRPRKSDELRNVAPWQNHCATSQRISLLRQLSASDEVELSVGSGNEPLEMHTVVIPLAIIAIALLKLPQVSARVGTPHLLSRGTHDGSPQRSASPNSACELCATVAVETFALGIRAARLQLQTPVFGRARGRGDLSTRLGIDHETPGVLRLATRSNISIPGADGPWEWHVCETTSFSSVRAQGECAALVKARKDVQVRLQLHALADFVPHLRKGGAKDLLYIDNAVSSLCGDRCMAPDKLDKLVERCVLSLGKASRSLCESRVRRSDRNEAFPIWWRVHVSATMLRYTRSDVLAVSHVTREVYSAALAAEQSRPVGVHLRIPLHDDFKILYLVQGRKVAQLGPLYSHLVRSADLLFVSHATPQPGASYFPGSLIGEGRNWLYLQARARERQQGWRYHYLCFLDDDVVFLRGSPSKWEAFLQRWQPAVATPSEYPMHAFIPDFFALPMDAYAVYHVDHNAIAYHHESIEQLWPLDTRFDKECWWTSQYWQTVAAAVRYRNHVLVAKETSVVNYDHGYEDKGYSWNVTAAFARATDAIRATLPSSAVHCARYVEDTPHGFPWGIARRKGPSVRYDLRLGSLQNLGADCVLRLAD